MDSLEKDYKYYGNLYLNHRRQKRAVETQSD